MKWLDESLAQLERDNLLRTAHPIAYTSNITARYRGRHVTVFCSNDYLGLRTEPRLVSAATEATQRHGTGSGASPLISGHLPPHTQAEADLAAHVQTDSALLTSSGFAANSGALAALVGPEDLVLSDALNHASLIDGCRLSRARIAVYPHCDLAALTSQLTHHRPYRRAWIVTESLFSMDGDLAPLANLRRLADRHGACLYVDEAHALGTLGPQGRGLSVDQGIRPDVLVGTLGKALGSSGAFLAGSTSLRAYLWNRCRSFVFSTALPPASAAAASAALQILQSDPAPRERLHQNIQHARTELERLGHAPISHPTSPILPVLLGNEQRALAVSARLLEQGYFVQAIRPPTVPRGSARLRITLSSAHTAEQIDGLLGALHTALAP